MLTNIVIDQYPNFQLKEQDAPLNSTIKLHFND